MAELLTGRTLFPGDDRIFSSIVRPYWRKTHFLKLRENLQILLKTGISFFTKGHVHKQHFGILAKIHFLDFREFLINIYI